MIPLTERGDHYVGSIEEGEWLQYTIHVARAGSYKVKFKLASDQAGGLIALTTGSRILKDNIVVPDTQALEKWGFVDVPAIRLEKGVNKIRVVIRKGGFNFSGFTFAKK